MNNVVLGRERYALSIPFCMVRLVTEKFDSPNREVLMKVLSLYCIQDKYVKVVGTMVKNNIIVVIVGLLVGLT